MADGISSLSDNLHQARRLQEMRAAWDGYLGKLPDSLKPQPGEPDTNVKSNRLGPIVDTGLFYLFGEVLNIEVDPSNAKRGIDVEAAQAALDGCWGDDDDKMTLLSKLAMNGAVFGQPFAKILSPVDTATGYCRVVVLDPQNITVQADPDDCDAAMSYTIQWSGQLPDGSTITKRQMISRRDIYEMMQALRGSATAQMQILQPNSDDAGTTGDNDLSADTSLADGDDGLTLDPLGDALWVIVTEARSSDGGDWIPLGDPIAWPHPWPPIVDTQNLPISNQHWGLPDLSEDLIQLNKTLNFILSNLNAIALNHGHPWIWVSGADMSQMQIAPGNIIEFGNIDAKLNALIANGDIAGLMAYAADIRASMDEQSKVPGVATGRISELPRGQMSGVALRMLYQPLLFKTTFKRRLYGKLIRELSTRMLALCGFGDGTDKDGVTITLHWTDPMPTDDLQEAQTAQAWQTIGVSADTLMQRGGFDPEVEATKKADESAREMRAWTRGQGMPPIGNPAVPLTDPNAANMQPGMQPGQPGQQNTPPVNHPAAIAARNKMSQLAGGQ